MTDTGKLASLVSALLASIVNVLLVGVLLVGFLQFPGREPDRIVAFKTMAWFIYLFPPLNILSSVIALFGVTRPRLRVFAWSSAAGATAFVVYIVLALFVWY